MNKREQLVNELMTTGLLAHPTIQRLLADERRRIREALLSDEAVFAFGNVVTARDDSADDATFAQWKEGIQLGFAAALAAIGLTEEGGVS